MIASLVALVFFVSLSPAPATITNGQNAIDELGQFAPPVGVDTTLSYTSYCFANGPTGINLANSENFPATITPVSDAIDTTNHWLFVDDGANGRILVFPLNTNNTLASKTASYALGAPALTSCATSYWFTPAALAVDPVHQRLYVAQGYSSAVYVFNTASMTNGQTPAYVLGAGPSLAFANYVPSSTTASTFNSPSGLAIDVTNQLLYVDDGGNYRVLVFNVATGTLANGESASYEIGVPSGAGAFTTVGTGAISQSTFQYGPLGLDTVNQWLYVTDVNDNRVLIFPAYANASWGGNGESASYVLGQTSFTTGNCNQGSSFATAATLCDPETPVVDNTDHLVFIADPGNERVLAYSTTALATGESASFVLGEPTMSALHNVGNNGGLYTSQTSMDAPEGLAFDPGNKLLYVNDHDDSRVTIFNTSSMAMAQFSVITQSGLDACGVTTGDLYCWGQNASGEDGIGGRSGTAAPLQVGTATNWTAVTEGDPSFDEDGCGLAGGALYCWGNNAFGELGLGNITQYTSPQRVGSAANWTAISTSGNDTCGIAGGALYCWGLNAYGEVGANVAAETVFVTSTTYTGAIGAGGVTGPNAACAARATAAGLSGTFLAWIATTTATSPLDTYFQSTMPYEETNGTIIARNAAGLISGTLLNGISLSESGTTQTGNVWTNVATTGAASTSSASSTTKNCAGWTNATASDKGSYGTVGATAGTWTANATATCSTAEHLYCFQQNTGKNEVTTPVQVGTATNWTAVSTGGFDTCGIAGGKLYCWGQNLYGELGLGNTNEYTSPQQVGNVAVLQQTSASNSSVTLPNPTTPGALLLVCVENQKAETSYTVSDSAGNTYTQAVAPTENANLNGSGVPETVGCFYAYSTSSVTADVITPVASPTNSSANIYVAEISGIVASSPIDVTATATGNSSTIASASATTTNANDVIFGLAVGSGAISPGSGFTTITTANGDPTEYKTVSTTGSYSATFSGSSQQFLAVMIALKDYNYTWTSVSQGGGDTCGISGGALYCWGANTSGELGLGNNTQYTTPQQVGTATNWTVISVMSDRNSDAASCGVSGGALYCSGNNAYGELGVGNTTQYTSPQQVGAITTWTTVSYGSDDTCGIAGGQLYCWGANTNGEDGVGNFTQFTTPQAVNVVSQASQTAVDEIGQYTSQTSAATVNWTQNGPQNGVNALGYSDPQSLAMDTANHLFYTVDSFENRINIYQLQTDNSISTASGGHTASYVLGATGFPTNLIWDAYGNYCTANILSHPLGIAFDGANTRLFVADSYDDRVLVFNTSPIANNLNATYAIGEPNLTTCEFQGTASQTQMTNPSGLAYDSVNTRLFVVDGGANRILVFNVPAGSNLNNISASYVLGQSNFTNVTSGTTSTTESLPVALAYDPVNTRLFVVDQGNNRVLVYNVPVGSNLTNKAASYVLGQTNFTGSSANAGSGSPTANGFNEPVSVAYDPTASRLFVADLYDARILVFNVAPGVIKNGENAVFELGQTPAVVATQCSGSYLTCSATGTTQGQFQPGQLYFDPGSQRLFSSDTSANRVMVFDVTPMTTNMNTFLLPGYE